MYNATFLFCSSKFDSPWVASGSAPEWLATHFQHNMWHVAEKGWPPLLLTHITVTLNYRFA
jgi:hypothetical protein